MLCRDLEHMINTAELTIHPIYTYSARIGIFDDLGNISFPIWFRIIGIANSKF